MPGPRGAVEDRPDRSHAVDRLSLQPHECGATASRVTALAFHPFACSPCLPELRSHVRNVHGPSHSMNHLTSTFILIKIPVAARAGHVCRLPAVPRMMRRGKLHAASFPKDAACATIARLHASQRRKAEPSKAV